jgi:hypothetical protein
MWGTLSDERMGLSFTTYSVLYIYIWYMMMWLYLKYTHDFREYRFSIEDYASSLVVSTYNSSGYFGCSLRFNTIFELPLFSPILAQQL